MKFVFPLHRSPCLMLVYQIGKHLMKSDLSFNVKFSNFDKQAIAFQKHIEIMTYMLKISCVYYQNEHDFQEKIKIKIQKTKKKINTSNFPSFNTTILNYSIANFGFIANVFSLFHTWFQISSFSFILERIFCLVDLISGYWEFIFVPLHTPSSYRFGRV